MSSPADAPDDDLAVPSEPALPARCEVLVVGAGPAGSACAAHLARAGHEVWLVDQHDFPRDKVCGDGLIPDAHQALQRLGVLDEVMRHAHAVSHVRCVAPRGGHVDVPGTLAVLPRRRLDALLCRHARRSGARVLTPARFESLIEQDGQVVGARLVHGGQTREVHTRWVVMATGAHVPALARTGLCDRRTPSGVALRAYVHHPGLAESHRTMDVVWHRALRPGYGWIFPCGGDVYNIGVGAFFRRGDTRERDRAADANLREVFDAFTRLYEPARALMDGGTMQGELRGAPLRCTLSGARSGRPGLLATGEMLGSTYDFTGEGIGKALETGLMAADTLLGAGTDDHATLADYERRLDTLRPKFALYERANRVNAHPWLADLVIWRARRSPRLLQRMSGVLNETSNPGHLISARGLLRLLTG
ncbi:geranylgeranyl reductase family protein [Sphaerotilus hippei]|uniref:Geranylgeranyl reductase family protein n=1 Tax=Sphaerotilus hippei TaxID=744406 RepID=A0A318GV15_9BURK|nr:geranylgeranyl reductase family protein [Sphaerotilus hippei]PXW92769.1 geranylgeranyl reductase family protein [Sphaerotilus hippei]